MEKLSRAQKDILSYIRRETESSGIPPTLRMIREKFNYSSLSSPRHHLKILAEKGYINLIKGISRGIELLDTGVPLLGEISAGYPVDAEENMEGYLDIKRYLSGESSLFCLRVRGDSMSGAGIMDGDIVFVRKQRAVRDGDIVAALIAGEALVKRFKISEEGLAVLKAENPSYPDISTGKDTLVIGKVTGVFRGYEQLPLY